MKPEDVPTDFEGCARECRKAGKHTLAWGRCEHAPEPAPPSKDDLRGLLIAAGLTSHKMIAEDGHPAIVMHTNEQAADRALKVFQEWMLGTREEIAARENEAAQRTPDDTVRLCETARPGEHERRVRERVAAESAVLDPKDLAELLNYVIGREGIRVVQEETLDRAFAALKATQRGES